MGDSIGEVNKHCVTYPERCSCVSWGRQLRRGASSRIWGEVELREGGGIPAPGTKSGFSNRARRSHDQLGLVTPERYYKGCLPLVLGFVDIEDTLIWCM